MRGKRTYRKYRTTKRTNAVKKIVKRVVEKTYEKKYILASLPSVGFASISSSPVEALCSISQGDAYNQRDGIKCTLKKIEFVGTLQGGALDLAAGDDMYNQVRLLITKGDKSSPLNTGSYNFNTTEYATKKTDPNAYAGGVDRCLFDKTYILQGTVGHNGYIPASKRIRVVKKVNIPLTFTPGSNDPNERVSIGMFSHRTARETI